MRLLLILVLLFASLGFVPTASAQAGHCHDQGQAQQMHGQHGEGHHGNRDREDRGGAAAIVHVCVGCAIMASSDALTVPAQRPGLPRSAAESSLPPAFDANPIPPPPRLA
ncbi:MAG TPA: DUF2946 family protein [Croceibacterium sp.]|nr:DUF2946 family protein [Croceibacterium sp.]